MADRVIPTPEELRQLLDYNPSNGALTWKPRPISMFAPGNVGSEKVCSTWNKRYAGTEAGSVNLVTGYRTLGLGKLVGAHRVAWAHFYGEWPLHVIDHINGDQLDNRIVNLRDVSVAINQRNCRKRVNNSTGVTGVARSPKGNPRWVAYIRVAGRRKHLGVFDRIEDAAAARKTAELEYGFTARHGA